MVLLVLGVLQLPVSAYVDNTNYVDVASGLSTVSGYAITGAGLAVAITLTVIGLGALGYWGRKATKPSR